MPSLAFNLSLFFTFPGFVSRDLPFIFGFPSLGLSWESQSSITASFDVGGISYAVGGERIVILNSSLGFGTNINNFDLMFGFTGTTAGYQG
jgi:hypothetical protein